MAHDEHGRTAVVATCTSCGAKETIPFKANNVPKVAVTKKFGQRGWQFSKDAAAATCSACNSPKKEVMPPNSSSNVAHKAQRTMFTLLEEHFDPDAGTYDEGWSDSKVAKKTGLSEKHVADVRESAFGSLRDPVFDQLRADISAVKAKLDDELNAATAMIREAKSAADREIRRINEALTKAAAR